MVNGISPFYLDLPLSTSASSPSRVDFHCWSPGKLMILIREGFLENHDTLVQEVEFASEIVLSVIDMCNRPHASFKTFFPISLGYERDKSKVFGSH